MEATSLATLNSAVGILAVAGATVGGGAHGSTISMLVVVLVLVVVEVVEVVEELDEVDEVVVAVFETINGTAPATIGRGVF